MDYIPALINADYCQIQLKQVVKKILNTKNIRKQPLNKLINACHVFSGSGPSGWNDT